MSMTRTRYNYGFTLIEIMVSVTILISLTGFLVAGYSRFNSSQTVTQAALTLKTNLRAVRTAAASGVKPAGCDTLVGYIVKFVNSSPATYTAQAVCAVGEIDETTTYTLPAGISISVAPAGSITFYALNQGTAEEKILTLTGGSTDKTVQIKVSASGSVEDVVSTPTP